MLEVIEHEQHRHVSQVVLELVGGAEATLLAQPECLGDVLQHQRRITLGGKINECDSVLELILELFGQRKREACLSYARWSDKSQEARPFGEHYFGANATIALAPDERRRRRGHAVAPRRAQRPLNWV
jgi:hypothetical protein